MNKPTLRSCSNIPSKDSLKECNPNIIARNRNIKLPFNFKQKELAPVIEARPTDKPVAEMNRLSSLDSDSTVVQTRNSNLCVEMAIQWRDYESDILNYIKEQESKYRIDHTYLKCHRSFTGRIRSFLVKYIYKIHSKYHLLRRTLFSAVYYLDKYLSKNYAITEQNTYVVVAQTAIFIAMKYEEIYPPEMAHWVDHKYHRDIFKMEAQMLKVLDFKLNCFTLENHVDYRMSKMERMREAQINKAHLLSDLSLFDSSMYQHSPSVLADCILRMASGQDNNSRLTLSVKWMTERNRQEMSWLIHTKYPSLLDFTY